MHQRYFTLEEALETVPKVSRIMTEVRDLKARVDAKIAAWRNVELPDPVEQAMARGQVDFLLGEINLRLEQVCDMGCLPKDLDQGLVDFPTQLAGQGEAYYCWQLGEEDIRFWHSITEGFQGRKPLQPPIRFYRTSL